MCSKMFENRLTKNVYVLKYIQHGICMENSRGEVTIFPENFKKSKTLSKILDINIKYPDKCVYDFVRFKVLDFGLSLLPIKIPCSF